MPVACMARRFRDPELDCQPDGVVMCELLTLQGDCPELGYLRWVTIRVVVP